MKQGFRDVLADIVTRNAVWVVAGIILLTILFGYCGRNVRVRTEFQDLFPQEHEYVKYYNKYKEQFGSANLILIGIKIKEGDIFSYGNLSVIRKLTRELDKFPGVDHANLESITHLATRDIIINESGMIKGVPLVPFPIPESEKAIEQIRFRTYANPRLIGDLISRDGSAALVRAAFIERYLDYEEIFNRLIKLRNEITVNNPNMSIYIAGDPMLRGWLFDSMDTMIIVFGITVIAMVGLLIFYFRRIYGVVLPMAGCSTAAVWGFGYIGLMGFTLDPLMVVVPFLISARAVSHGVQMIDRFFEEYEKTNDKVESARNAFRNLVLPGTISAVSDAAGIFVITTASFPLLVKLALYCSLWSLTMIPTVIFFIPALLCLLPKPGKREHFVPDSVSSYLRKITFLSTQKTGRVIASTIVVAVLCVAALPRIIIGTEEVGSNLLFEDSDYNVSAREINKYFPGTNNFQLFLTGNEEYVIVDNGPEVLEWMGNYKELMLADPAVGGAMELNSLVSSINQMLHCNDPKWNFVPASHVDIANLLFIYTASAPQPGALDPWMNEKRKNAAVTLFVKNLKSNTVGRVIEETKNYVVGNALPPEIHANLAGGLLGLTAATNEEIRRSNFLAGVLIILIVFILILLSYRSLVAGFLMLCNLGLAMLITFAYMALTGIGLDVSTLPVICLGIGVGVDYSVYIFDRIKAEYKGDIDEAITRALNSSGKCVSFTATTSIVGIIFWKFFSPLRFQADMSLLITILMLLCMLTATILLPAVIKLTKPKIIVRQ